MFEYLLLQLYSLFESKRRVFFFSSLSNRLYGTEKSNHLSTSTVVPAVKAGNLLTCWTELLGLLGTTKTLISQPCLLNVWLFFLKPKPHRACLCHVTTLFSMRHQTPPGAFQKLAQIWSFLPGSCA